MVLVEVGEVVVDVDLSLPRLINGEIGKMVVCAVAMGGSVVAVEHLL